MQCKRSQMRTRFACGRNHPPTKCRTTRTCSCWSPCSHHVKNASEQLAFQQEVCTAFTVGELHHSPSVQSSVVSQPPSCQRKSRSFFGPALAFYRHQWWNWSAGCSLYCQRHGPCYRGSFWGNCSYSQPTASKRGCCSSFCLPNKRIAHFQSLLLECRRHEGAGRCRFLLVQMTMAL